VLLLVVHHLLGLLFLVLAVLPVAMVLETILTGLVGLVVQHLAPDLKLVLVAVLDHRLS
jgi:hypothetical protein